MDATNKRRLRYFFLALLAMTIFIGWQAGWVVDRLPIPWTRRAFRIGCILLDLLLLARVLHLVLLKSEWRPGRKKMSMVVAAFLGIVLLLEIPFMYVPYSHGHGNTYAGRIWFHNYWQENKLGYRDTAPDFEADGTRKRVMVLGDSFVAGHGIENPADRFSDLLAGFLGSGYRVYNLGKNGADTRAELDSLKNFPVRPDILIWSHIPNDMEGVMEEDGPQAFRPVKRINGVQQGGFSSMEFLSKGSFSLNYFFWKFNHWRKSNKVNAPTMDPGEFQWGYMQAWTKAQLIKAHYAQIGELLSWCRTHNVKVLALTFPETYERGIDYTQMVINEPLARYLEEQGVPCLHTYDSLHLLTQSERIVNSNDAHPSVRSHKMVAQMLHQKLQDLQW